MKSTLQKFSRKFGRRTHDRFSIPGATVSWKPMDRDAFPEETLPLSDISRFGLSLLANTPPQVNSIIALRINLPREPEKFDLLGKVVYAIFRGPGLTYEYRVGIQLQPFSETEGDNPPELQQKIQELEQMYGKRFDQVDIED
ncbi:MAG: PilZ domain-containing protein [Acidobacteria bacterium]|nr:PilZ domain-containing protein [Acidobacteriota bacterium]